MDENFWENQLKVAAGLMHAKQYDKNEFLNNIGKRKDQNNIEVYDILFDKEGKTHARELGKGVSYSEGERKSGLYLMILEENDGRRFYSYTNDTGSLNIEGLEMPPKDEDFDPEQDCPKNEQIYSELIGFLVKYPDQVAKIPVAFFEYRESFGEEILTAYQEKALQANSVMASDIDRAKFIDEIKKDVLQFNEAFNNIERAIRISNTQDFFKRDREV